MVDEVIRTLTASRTGIQTRQARADKQSQLRANRLITKSSPYIRLQILNKQGLLMAQFSRYQFIPSAKLFTQYISRPFLFKIYGCDLVVNLLDIIGYLSGLCLSTPACRVGTLQTAGVGPDLVLPWLGSEPVN